MDEQSLRQTIANNLLFYRKKFGFTQSELAEKLNYSDKLISKWERAEGIPDVYTLCKIADIYKININNLIYDTPKKFLTYKINKDIITLFASVIVWLVAVVVFVFLELLLPQFDKSWLCFIYAIPVSLIVLFIFNNIFKRHLMSFILISLLIWGILLSIFLSLRIVNIWLIFIIGIPLQILTVLWYILKRPIK